MLDGLGFNIAVRHDYIDVTLLVLAYKFGDFEFGQSRAINGGRDYRGGKVSIIFKVHL